MNFLFVLELASKVHYSSYSNSFWLYWDFTDQRLQGLQFAFILIMPKAQPWVLRKFGNCKVSNKDASTDDHSWEGGCFRMIYCVEDDRAIRDLMIYTLRASGFEAMGFENDSGFWTAMKRAAAGNDLAGCNAARRRWTDNPSKTAVIPCYIGYSRHYGHCKRQRVRQSHWSGFRCGRLSRETVWNDGNDLAHKGGPSPCRQSSGGNLILREYFNG